MRRKCVPWARHHSAPISFEGQPIKNPSPSMKGTSLSRHTSSERAGTAYVPSTDRGAGSTFHHAGPDTDLLVQPSIRAHPRAQHQFGPGRASFTERPPRGHVEGRLPRPGEDVIRSATRHDGPRRRARAQRHPRFQRPFVSARRRPQRPMRSLRFGPWIAASIRPTATTASRVS